MNSAPVYLDSYTLQSDRRIRLPKSVINNMNAVPEKTMFSIYYDSATQSIIMKKCGADSDEAEKVEQGGVVLNGKLS